MTPPKAAPAGALAPPQGYPPPKAAPAGALAPPPGYRALVASWNLGVPEPTSCMGKNKRPFEAQLAEKLFQIVQGYNATIFLLFAAWLEHALGGLQESHPGAGDRM